MRRGRARSTRLRARPVGGLIASIVFVLFVLAQLLPGRALAVSASPIIVMPPPGGPDVSPVEFAPEALLGLSQWGEKRPLEQQVPHFTLPGQAVAPCDAEAGEVAIHGNCWANQGGAKPPCRRIGVLFRYEDKSYRPIAADPKKPAEPGPDHLRAP